MHLAVLFLAVIHIKPLLIILALAVGSLAVGTTIAYPGYGSKLASGGVTGAAYTNVAQLKKFNFSGLKAEFDDITNLDSPSIFKEWMKTVVDGDTVSFDGVMNPADPTTQALLTNIATAGSAALFFWKITLTNGSTLIFQGYVQDFKFGAEYNKAITFSGAIKIVGNVAATW
jgi:predicted secreted protein